MSSQAGCFNAFFGLRKKGSPHKPQSPSKGGISGTDDSHLECDTTTQPPLTPSDAIAQENYKVAADICNEECKDLPPYSPNSIGVIYRPEVMNTIEATIRKFDDELRDLSLKIHDHPEIMFEERFAHAKMTAFMVSHGFTVTKHYLGMQTAWRAEFIHGEGGRTLGLNAEMDALPRIGHACGHNLIAISGVAVALAVKAALEAHDVSGRIVLLGTPGEEGGAGKVILMQRGGYKDIDACLMCHPSSGPTHSASLASSLAYQAIEVEYYGRAAHVAFAPWEGQNALDAAFLAYSGVSVLRQQIRPDHRVHGVVLGTDDHQAHNVIPDYAKMRWFLRAPSWEQLLALRDRIDACLKSAALAASCKYKITFGEPLQELRQNSALATDFAHIIQNRYGMFASHPHESVAYSTDFGNVSYECPAIHPVFTIPTEPDGGNHTAAFTVAARTMEAHKACLTVSQGLALTGFRFLDDEEFYRDVKRSFKGASAVLGNA